MHKALVHFLEHSRSVSWPNGCEEATLERVLQESCEVPYGTSLRVLNHSNRMQVSLCDILSGTIPEIIIEFRRKEYVHQFSAAEGLISLMEPPSIQKDRSSKKKYDRYNEYDALLGDKYQRQSVSIEDSIFNTAIPPQPEFRGRSLQEQMTKFSRILAHLVNERTVLAWFRTDLAFITLSIKYMKLAEKYDESDSSRFVGPLLLLCGGLFMTILPFSLYSGYERFRVCKNMLDFDITKISSYLHIMGFDFDNFTLGLLIGLSFVCIIISSSLIIWTTE